MQFENNIPHPHYKKVVIGITIFIVAVVLAVLGYYYFSTKKAEKARDLMLRAEYQAEQDRATEAFFGNFDSKPKPITDADKKNLEAFYASIGSGTATNDNETKEFYNLQLQQAEQNYQAWKANQQ